MPNIGKQCLNRAALASLLMLAAARAGAQETLPDDFAVDVLAAGLNEPVALTATDDGRLFVGERGGRIYRINGCNADEPVATEPVAELEVYTLGETGLLGLTAAPDFATNQTLYAFVTTSSVEQRILRLVLRDDGSTEVETVRANLPTNGSVHNGGGIAIGPDGRIYFSIGDGGQPELAEELTSLAGKISRINTDGSVPEDNPFVTPTGTPRAVFATGLRNTFRFCFASDGTLFAGDVGSNGDQRFEELNIIKPGKNYGWPTSEGVADDADGSNVGANESVAPILAYHDEGAAITGCVVYEGAQFPAEYRGNVFHLDYVSGALFRVVLSGETVTAHTRLMTPGGGPTDLVMLADGSLAFCELFRGSVKRLRYQSAATAGDCEPEVEDELAEPVNLAPAAAMSTCGTQIGMLVIAIGLLGLSACR